MGPEYKLHSIDYHRNGSGGQPFHVVKFYDYTGGPHDPVRMLLAVVFVLDEYQQEDKDAGRYINPPTAVFRMSKLAEGEVRFMHNSWRGDRYDEWLREQIDKEVA